MKKREVEEKRAKMRVERIRNHLSLVKTSESKTEWLRRVAFGSNPESNLHAGDLVTNVLISHGVKFIFTLSGGHISPILVGAEEKGIRVIDVRHEVNAVFAADAVARLSGRCGVAAVTVRASSLRFCFSFLFFFISILIHIPGRTRSYEYDHCR